MPKVTYGRLDQVLRALGFSVRDPDPETRVYEHESGARLIIPVFPERKMAYPHHLAATRMILDYFGIMDPPEFESRLQKAS